MSPPFTSGIYKIIIVTLRNVNDFCALSVISRSLVCDEKSRCFCGNEMPRFARHDPLHGIDKPID